MAHTKCYAIGESKCKVETLSKETLDYRYWQTDNRLSEVHKNLLSLNNEITKLRSKVNQVNDSFLNFYVVEWSDMQTKINGLEKQLIALKEEVNKISDDFQNVYITEFADLTFKVNNLEKRIEALENAK